MTAQEMQVYIDENIRFNDWTFTVTEQNEFCVVLEISFMAPDNFEPSKIVPVKLSTSIETWVLHSTEIFINFLWDRVKQMIVHEAGEQFYINGRLPFNEHKPIPLEQVL